MHMHQEVVDIIIGVNQCTHILYTDHAVRHILTSNGRKIVMELLRELDPSGVERRKANRLRRRLYLSKV